MTWAESTQVAWSTTSTRGERAGTCTRGDVARSVRGQPQLVDGGDVSAWLQWDGLEIVTKLEQDSDIRPSACAPGLWARGGAGALVDGGAPALGIFARCDVKRPPKRRGEVALAGEAQLVRDLGQAATRASHQARGLS